jgi:cell division protein FtsZ
VEPRKPLPSSDFDSEVEAAISMAIKATGLSMSEIDKAKSDNVTVEPYIPSGTKEFSLEEPSKYEERPLPRAHVPQQAERPDAQRRMPRVDELPPIARQGIDQPTHSEPRNARALFKRLASNVGINLDAAEPQPAESRREPTAESPSVDDAAARAAIEQGNPRAMPPLGDHGAQGQLDPHGRATVQHPTKEHLEIPAFLRKHG